MKFPINIDGQICSNDAKCAMQLSVILPWRRWPHNLNKFSTAPYPDPPPVGRGTPPPHTLPHLASSAPQLALRLRRSTLVPSPTSTPGSAYALFAVAHTGVMSAIYYDVVVRSCFFRSWKLRILETCPLFDVLFRPINDNTRVFDVCCILSPCWHWKLCHYLVLDRFSCNSIGRGNVRGNMSRGKCPTHHQTEAELRLTADYWLLTCSVQATCMRRIWRHSALSSACSLDDVTAVAVLARNIWGHGPARWRAQ